MKAGASARNAKCANKLAFYMNMNMLHVLVTDRQLSHVFHNFNEPEEVFTEAKMFSILNRKYV